MTQKVIRSPFAGIDFTGDAPQQEIAPNPGQIINFSNDTPSFPVDLPKSSIKPKQPIMQPIPKNFSLPNQNQELSGNISLVGGVYPKNNINSSSDVLDEPPLLEGNKKQK